MWQALTPRRCARAGLGSSAFYGMDGAASPADDQGMALLLLKGALDPGGQRLGSWQAGTNPCQGWAGVACDGAGRVTRLCALPRPAASVPRACSCNGVDS
jgi:hypothetical protein